jgi:hypothetical protein
MFFLQERTTKCCFLTKRRSAEKEERNQMAENPVRLMGAFALIV